MQNKRLFQFLVILSSLCIFLISCKSDTENDAQTEAETEEFVDTTVSTPEAPVTPPPPQAPPRSSQPSYMELISDTGNFTVQVAANRNRYMAERTLNKWHSDGFEPAFIAVEGDEETGDIWYRVFFGRYSNFKDAEAMSEILRNTFERDAFPRRYNR